MKTGGFLRCARGLALIVALALLVVAPGARGHGAGEELFERADVVLMPSTDSPPNIDGQIEPGEYPARGTWSEEGEGLELSLAHNGSAIFVGIQQPGWGWIGVALSSDVDAGANVIEATLNATGSVITDNYAANVTDEMDNEPDTDVGGTSDVLAFAATNSSSGATYEFAIPLDSPDPRDHRLEPGSLYPLVVAFNETAQELPGALGDGDVHFLRVYVARATDDLTAIEELFMANPSPVPALAAMAVFSFAAGVVIWLYVGGRREGIR